VRGLGRGRIAALVKGGLGTPEKVADVPIHDLSGLVTKSVAERLKRDLSSAGVDTKALVENNGEKQYRWSVPPRNITLDENITQHMARTPTLPAASAAFST
jgi:hypothetical protein